MSNSVGDKQEICLLFAKTDLIQSLYGRTEKFGQALTDLMYGIAQGAKQENQNEDPEQ